MGSWMGGVDGEEDPGCGFSRDHGGSGLVGCDSQMGGLGSLCAGAEPLLGPLAQGQGRRKAARQEGRSPDSSMRPAPESSVEACSGLLSSHPPASLPQAPARPDAVHQRCREPFIR